MPRGRQLTRSSSGSRRVRRRLGSSLSLAHTAGALYRASSSVRPSSRSYSRSRSRRPRRSQSRSTNGGGTRGFGNATGGVGGAGSGNDAGRSMFAMRFRPKKKFLKGLKRILAPQALNSVVPSRLQSGAASTGFQLVQDLFAYQGSTGTPWPYICSGGTNGDLTDANTVLQTTEAAATNIFLGNNLNRTRRMMMNRISVMFQIKNQTNIPVRVTLYDCVARRDATVAVGPTAAWSQGVTREAVVSAGTSNSLNLNFPGAKPFQSQYFCQLWKVKRSVTFELHAGSVHWHRVMIKPGGVFSAEYTTTYDLLKGLSTCVMMVLEGGLVDNNTTFAGATTVTTSSFACDVVAESNYSFTAMERSRTAYTQFGALAPNLAENLQFAIAEDTDQQVGIDAA
uniref:Putative capsid protein n=1 Tax=Grus japonensis CRESS-DNA-virus sp. TaxID=2815045 RepID=A0A8A4XCD7_9VIRU|nr:MAG: putative capsid protein [Grus japonensis CRESS-DNA-virus sp.]